MPILSIIIPVYNIEDYLEECIDSIVQQNVNDVEVVLVNDGSKDKSSEICDLYARKYDFIVAHHKKNGGLSDARNAGFKIAKGKYIYFLDGDDYMVKGGLISMLEFLREDISFDIVTFPLIHTDSDGTEISSIPMKSSLERISKDEFLNRILESDFLFWGVEKNIYVRNIIEKNNLKFPTGLIGAEDCDFSMEYLKYCTEIILLDNPLSHYRINREGSITNNMSIRAILGQLNVFYNNYSYFKEKNNSKLEHFFANKYANTLSLLYFLEDKSEIEQVNQVILGNKDILSSTSGIKYTVAKLIWRVFGFYTGSKIIKRIRISPDYKEL